MITISSISVLVKCLFTLYHHIYWEGYNMGLGNLLKGGISGAGAGAAFGPHGAAIGAALGVGASLLGGFNSASGGGTSIAGSKALMDHQLSLNKDYTKWMNENGYSQMRTGLENAGYNPILALGASPASGSVGIANATEGTSAKGVTLNNLASIMNTTANTKLQEQQAETEFAKRVNLSADTGLKLADTMYKKGLIKWQDLQNYAELALKRSSSAMNTASAKASLRNADTNYYNAVTNRNRKSVGGLGFNYSFSYR
ncbi:DNA pilot protein [Microvirus mar37]|uniref:DNA pilot protein n=1 Tax=Microvirus mar37 TaxID=2851171 RepID=A0A8F5ML41_9VIRU|nr:DNA pilot protein [Microvirus mar37]